MKRWPAWSAPLLGGFGGALAGLAITVDPRFPFAPLYATLGGVTAGALAGLVVWLLDKLRTVVAAAPSPVPQCAISAPSSRWKGFLLMVAGLGCLAANHALVVATGKELLALVVGGSFFFAVGLAGLLLPQILTAGDTAERVPWWGNFVGGILAVAGLALRLFLWLAVRRDAIMVTWH